MPGIPDSGQKYPQQLESQGKSGARLILLLDPTLAFCQLAFCGQDPCRQGDSGTDESQYKSVDVSSNSPEIRNCLEDDLGQATNLSHRMQNTESRTVAQGLRKPLLYKADEVFRGQTQPMGLTDGLPVLPVVPC